MNVRFAGALLAVAIAYVVVVLPLDDLEIGWLGLVDEVALLGAPVAGLLAWWLTPSAVAGSWRRAGGIGLLVGGLAAPLGVLALAYGALLAWLAGNASNVGTSGPAAAFVIAYFGVGFSVFVLPVTIPAGLAWGLATRSAVPRLGGRDPGVSPFGPVELALILIAVAIGAAIVPPGGV